MPFSKKEAWSQLTPWNSDTNDVGSVWITRSAGPFQLEVVQQQGEKSYAAFILLNEREYRLPGMHETLKEAQLYLMNFMMSSLHQLLVRLTSEE